MQINARKSLPQLGIYSEQVTREQAGLAELRHRDIADPDALIAAADRLYRRARDAFWQYGDREAEYLQADILNAEMIDNACDLDSLERPLREYQQFITATGFEDLASYPHLYYLRWHVLQRYRALYADEGKGARLADEHLAHARGHLEQVLECDAKVGNRYGLMRARLLGLLLDGLLAPLDTERLVDLRAQARELGYGHERRLLDHLATPDPTIIADLRTAFRFYPFVHQ